MKDSFGGVEALSDLRVSLKKAGGSSWSFKPGESNSSGACYTVSGSSVDGFSTVIFLSKGLESYAAGDTFTVKVSSEASVDVAEYRVSFFDL